MNLRVELILPAEQRSASVVSVKGLLRIAAIVVPVLLLFGISSLVWGYTTLSNQLKLVESRWALTEPRQKAARTLRENAAKNEALAKQLSGWANARLSWGEHLRIIQRNVTPELKIQLSKLSIEPAMVLVEKNPARSFNITIQATAFGENAENNVLELRKRLLTDPALTNYVDSAEITRFEQSPVASHTKLDRLFYLAVRYVPRLFK